MAMTQGKKSFVAATVVVLALAAVVMLVHRLDIPHRMALAEGRRIIASHKAELLDLTPFYEWQATNFYQAKNSPFPSWTVVPRGFQTFAHVPLQIDGMKCLWGSGNAQHGLIFAEEVLGIPMNRKFETLYVYHAAFYVTPPGTPVYEVVFRYEDGSSATNQVLYGMDVLDWYANRGKTVIGPTGPHSKLAWQGAYSSGGHTQPLRFCLTALENPQPFLEVTSIDLYSCKSISAACIMAMTPGKSGLMH
jgi:hypothetical protein